MLPQPHQLQTSINGPWGGVLALCKPAAQSCHLAGSQLTQLSFWGAISYRSTHHSVFTSSRGVVGTPCLSLAFMDALTSWVLITAFSPSFPPFFARNGSLAPRI